MFLIVLLNPLLSDPECDSHICMAGKTERYLKLMYTQSKMCTFVPASNVLLHRLSSDSLMTCCPRITPPAASATEARGGGGRRWKQNNLED